MMSWAWVTTLAVGILLLAAFGVVVEPDLPGLSTYAWWQIALVLALGVYGACFAAVSVPRIFDPKLSIPRRRQHRHAREAQARALLRRRHRAPRCCGQAGDVRRRLVRGQTSLIALSG
jgi:hypothetical protein